MVWSRGASEVGFEIKQKCLRREENYVETQVQVIVGRIDL